MVNPVQAPTPEDDPERTELIPKASDSGASPARPPRGGTEEKSTKNKVGKHRRPPKKQPLWREVLTLLVIAFVLTFLIQHFLGRVYSIPSGSMEQTLHGCPGCTGDRVLVDKLVYDFRDPKPGDVVVFEGPESWTENDTTPQGSSNAVVHGLQWLGSLVGLAPPNERDFVKRVVAVGGQTVQCCDDKWRVMVDGRPLDEPYIYWQNGKPDGRQRFDPVTVPEGTLWVMGDNRSDSCDSRSRARRSASVWPPRCRHCGWAAGSDGGTGSLLEWSTSHAPVTAGTMMTRRTARRSRTNLTSPPGWVGSPERRSNALSGRNFPSSSGSRSCLPSSFRLSSPGSS